VNVYPFIEAEKAGRRNVKRACELLKVSRAAFYQHLAGPSRRERADAELAEKVTQIHRDAKGRYGPRGSTRCWPAGATIMAASASPG
jgi:hypothetical protein